MDYLSFVVKAKAQDKKNIFTKYDGNLSFVPNELKIFYQKMNPVDVELDCDGISVHFWPATELEALQSEYAYLDVKFVFATCNGDPIFLNEGKIYICPHGVHDPKHKLVAQNIEDYLSTLFQ